MEHSWGEYGRYGTWFSAGLNNAQLSTVASYNTLVPFFNEILDESGGDLSVFYVRVAELAELDEVERDRRLERN
jgi:predicted aminopeptidase